MRHWLCARRWLWRWRLCCHGRLPATCSAPTSQGGVAVRSALVVTLSGSGLGGFQDGYATGSAFFHPKALATDGVKHLPFYCLAVTCFVIDS